MARSGNASRIRGDTRAGARGADGTPVRHRRHHRHACGDPIVVSLTRGIGDARLAAEAATLAGHAALFAGELDEAQHLIGEALTGADDADLRWEKGHTLVAAGQLALLRGDLEDADRAPTRAVEIGRSIGNDFTLAAALNRRATVTALRGDLAATAALLAESTARSLDARMSWTLSYALPALAGIAVRLDEPESAAMLFAASASLSAADAVDPRFPVSRDLAALDLATARDALGEKAFQSAWDAGRAATTADIRRLAEELTRRALA